MGLLDVVKDQFLDVIEYEDKSNKLIVVKFQRESGDNELKQGSKVIVRESQCVVFLKGGRLADILSAGTYSLDTENFPVLSKLQAFPYLFVSPVIADVALFMREIFGTKGIVMTYDIVEYLSSMVTETFSAIVGETTMSVLDLAAGYMAISSTMQDRLNDQVNLIGIHFSDVIIESISLPEDVEKIIDEQSGIGIAKRDMESFVQYQTARAMREAAKQEGGSAGRKSDEKKNKKAEYRWPTSELVSLIPQPEIKYGKINSENKDFFAIDIYGMSNEQFEDYIEECKESGFTVDYSRFEGSYSANDVDGFSLMLTYNEKGEQMSIMLNAPDDESSESSEVVPESQATEAAESEETEATETESMEPIETEDTEAEPARSAEATETTESEETKDNEEDEAEETNLIDGMRPEFKEAMDSYEAFYIDYCDFMKKYTENPTDLGLITEYTDMIKKLADMDEKFEAWESDDLNSAEVKYYAEVQGRVTQKILEIAE